MANIFNVARYILHCQGNMSTWKLQKLCYYAQVWSLAWTEKPLFDEDFEAWANGPVAPVLFYKHKGKFAVSEDDFPASLETQPVLTDDEKDTINKALEFYGDMEPYQLREQTHSELPWKNARGGLPEGVSCHNVILKDDIGIFYGSL